MSESYARISDPKAAETLVKRTARNYRSAQGKVRTLTADAAYATEAAFANGLIGKGSAFETARDYAAAYEVSPSAVTLWKRLGRALVVGVTTDSAAWQTLAFRSAANDKPVAEAIMADGATVASIVAALGKSRTPDGKRVAAGNGEGTPNDGTDAADKPEAKGIPVEVTDPAARVMLAIALVEAEVRAAHLSADQWSKAETALHKIITREVTLLRKAADKAADKAAADAEKIAS